jgi:hypothetical protein
MAGWTEPPSGALGQEDCVPLPICLPLPTAECSLGRLRTGLADHYILKKYAHLSGLALIGRATAVALGVGLHFLAFAVPVFLPEKLGKEFGVGLFFALGAYACLGATGQTLPLFGSIALVVAFNSLFIAARDASSDRANDPGGASRWWQTMNRDPLWIGVALTLAAVLAASLVPPMAFYLSVAAALALLTVLHRCANRRSGDTLRALADFALFTPIPVIGIMQW